MASFWLELRRRNVIRVAVAYLAAVWVLIQVADVVLPNLGAPTWIMQALMFSSALGFPLALILAWFYEFTPEGIKTTDDVGALEATKFTGRKIDFAIIALLVLALGFVLVRSPEESPQVLANSVAVLPLENLSPDANDAYFAFGLHDEILSQLTKLSRLNVISRTSVMRYRNTDLSIPEIARELNVETVMEGTVRYANDQVRITTQLIDATTGGLLWSETYEREFADVFAVESEIALNVANAMQVEFSAEEQDSLERIPTSSPAAYALYLQALASTSAGLGRPAPELDRAIALDPNFAIAYADKAVTLSSGLNFSTAVADPQEIERMARENALRALELDPTLGVAHSALAGIAEANWQWQEAMQRSEEAYRLSPNDIGVIGQHGRMLRSAGRFEEAIEVLRRGTTLDPNRAFSFQQLGITYNNAGQYDLAATSLRRALELSLEAGGRGIGNTVNLALAEAHRGNTEEALRLLQTAEELMDYRPNQPFRYGQMGIAYARLGQPEEAQRLFDALVERANEGDVGDANWAFSHVALGEYDEALERLEAAMEAPKAINYTALIMMKLNEWSDPVLEEPRFQDLLRDLWPE